MTRMSMGANVPLAATSIRAVLRWSAMPGTPDVDASALLVGSDGTVAAEADFVFYNQPAHPSGAVRMGGRSAPPRPSDTIELDLDRVPADVLRIVLAASVDGGSFGQVPGLELVVQNRADGRELALFAMRAHTETAFVCAEVYRRDATWRFRAIGQGYASGLAGLAADYGIDAVTSDGGGAVSAPRLSAGAPSVSSPAAAAPPPARTAPPAALPAATAPVRTSGLLDLDVPVEQLGLR